MNSETQLLQLLIQEKKLAINLLELMVQEKNALEQSLMDELTTITTKKSDCLDLIEQASRRRSQFLITLSQEKTTVARMKDFTSRQSPTAKNELNLELSNLESVLEKCRHQNSVNGMVITMSQRNVQRNLNIIKGSDNESMTYTPKGQTTSIGNTYSGLKV